MASKAQGDTRPYSSPNYPKEEKNNSNKSKANDSGTRPYSSPNYKKEESSNNNKQTQQTQQQKGTSSSASSQQQPSQPQQSSSSSSSSNQQQNNQPNYYDNGQQKQGSSSSSSSSDNNQQKSNEAFINSLQGNNVTNLKKNTDVAEKLNIKSFKPTNVLNKAVKERQAELQKNLEATDNKEIKASNLDKFADETYWSNGRKQSVSYATSIDYYNMERRGYKTVYVEDGTGALENKAGIYTIGRDNLAGLPSGTNTVLVDNQGHWKYLADTTERAAHVDALNDKLDALNKDFEDKVKNEKSLSIRTKFNQRQLEHEINKLMFETRNNKDPEKLHQLDELVGAYNACGNVVNDCNSRLREYGKQWAEKYESYNIMINEHQKWSVEDEARYRSLEDNLQNLNHGQFAELQEMRKRRSANSECSAFLDTDYINKLKKDEESMKKAIDEYNKWDSVTIHTEKGEDLGTQIKRLMILNTVGVTKDASNIVEKAKAYEGITSGLKKNFAPIAVAHSEYKRAANEYYEVSRRIANKEYKDENELADLYAKRTEYLKASEEAIKQGKAIMFNNIVSDLSVFDTTSIQSTFVAWRMAKHPDRYSDDPKWQKMKEAYKAIYGTDFRGKMDAGKMAMAMVDVKLGKTGVNNDYIYLDGSDLRHAGKNGQPGEKYGLAAALAVGMLTDVSFVTGLGKTAAGAATKIAGAKAITEAATDSYLQCLVRSGVSREAAEEFVQSRAVQRAIYKDVKKSISKSIKENGDDLRNLVNDALTERSKVFEGAFAKDIGAGIDNARYMDFLNSARETVMASGDITRATLQVEKGTLLTNALGTLDDALNNMQSAMFKVACPAAGAVVGVAKINKAVQELRNFKLADEQLLHRAVETSNLAMARVAEMRFDDVLDGVHFYTKCQDIMDEWAYGVMGANKANTAMTLEHAKLFCQYQDNMMREVSNSYVNRVINELDRTLSERGMAGLEELAVSKNFSNFNEMYDTIRTNLSTMYAHSPDAQGIVSAFDSTYTDAINAIKVNNVKEYVNFTDKHIDFIKSTLNTDGNTILSPINALAHPEFVQGNARTISNNIRDFLRKVNNDYTQFADADGVIHSIHESGAQAIDALNTLSRDASDPAILKAAQDALDEYVNEVSDIYLKQLKDWEANTLQDMLGVQNYLGNINSVIPNHGTNRELINKVADKMQKFFEDNGVNMSKQDIMDNIIKENPNEFLSMSDKQKQAVIYSVMENKGSSVIGQINDKDLKAVTDALSDCNSQLNKNLRLLQLEMDNADRAREYITQAITNSTAVEHSRMIYNALKEQGVDSSMSLAVMDAMSGNSNYINSIVQAYPPDIAAAKIRDYIVDEAKKQFSLHNGTYSLFTDMRCSGIDVSENVLNIEKNLAQYVPEDDQYLDICVSMVKSTDGTAPKDIAFHTRGAAGEPTVLRKEGKFTIYDDNFARRTYGSTAQQLNDSYAALGDLRTLSDDEWIRSFQNYINEQKQIALDSNKTIRFIGFNSSDAVSGGNKFLSDTLRSCGVNANTANAIDMADILRASRGEYVFDPKDLEAITRSVRTAVDSASSRSVSLGIRSVIAYDPKYTCVDMLQNAFKNKAFGVKTLDDQAKYVYNYMKTVSEHLGTDAYNRLGQAMGAYIDATAFEKALQDAGLTNLSASGNIMRIITDTVVDGESQLGLHKIIEDAMDAQWIDKTKFTGAYNINTFTQMERVHDSILQINRINNSIHRADLITDADIPALKSILEQIKYKTGIGYHNGLAYSIARSLKVDELSAQQLYAADKWLLDAVKKYMDPEKYDEFFGILLTKSPEQVTKLTDMGYKFIKDNIVDYTNDSLDAFLVKFLDTSEEGYKFAQDLHELDRMKDTFRNTEAYMDAVEGLFKRYDVHGVQDRMILYQLADVHRPIIELQDDMRRAYESAYNATAKQLKDEAKRYISKKNKYVKFSDDMVDRLATEEGVRAAKEYIMHLGDNNRRYAVMGVANLSEDAFRAHLVRNCCGGMIIDPTAKCVEGLDLVTLFEQWSTYKGVRIDTLNFSDAAGIIKDRKLFRVSLADLDDANMDEIFAKYDHAAITFNNPIANKFGKNKDTYIRHTSFGASDMTLMNANHVDTFRELFFKDKGTILDLNKNFSSWSDELYCCNMWTDMDLKQLVNPYYTDNMINNLAQNTHQLRNNIAAVHDFGTIVNNRYMNARYILEASGIYDPLKTIAEQRTSIIAQLRESNQRLCTLTLDANKHYRVVDYTSRLLNKHTDDAFFKSILENTIMLDEGMVRELSDWGKTTSIALKLQGSRAPEWISNAYNIYKKTVRNATITWYLYGNLGTAIRNYVDSSTKGLNEVMQYNEDMLSYLKHYKDAVAAVHNYSNIYRQIEEELGTVNRETVAKFFDGNKEGLDKFNLLYGYEHTCGGDSLLQDAALSEVRSKNVEYIREGVNIDKDTAEAVRKTFDDVYGSSKFYGMTNAQLEKHMVEIHDKCMERIQKRLGKKLNDTDLNAISEKFWNYHPTTTTWGDKMAELPVLKFNRERFNNAEVRARLAIYQTFIEGGATEAEAMKHVTATQFHYAGLGKVEDFMPFTQYKLYNALYWFDHANARAVSTAWRAAQYNGDGASTNKEISDMIAKYMQKKYYIYDKGMDAAYDEYFENNIKDFGDSLFDAENYLGLPREFSAGNLNLDGTHYLKLGNSFVEELDLVSTCMATVALFGMNMYDVATSDAATKDKLRQAYEAFKCTPLYDSFYSPWKSYADLVQYTYDHKEMIAKKNGRDIENYRITTKDVFDCYENYFLDKDTSRQAWAGIPVVGAILSNMSTRWKNFDLNQGLLAALALDPDAKQELGTYIRDVICDMTGMLIPSVVGTKVEPETKGYNYYRDTLSKILVYNPGTFYDFQTHILELSGELQREGFTEDQVKEITDTLFFRYKTSEGSQVIWLGDRSKADYFEVIKKLYEDGYAPEEIVNLFKQHKLPASDKTFERFNVFSSMLPNYLKYDKEKRSELIAYYKAMGLSSDEYWARMINHPSVIINGHLVELNRNEVLKYNKQQQDAYYAMKKSNGLTQEEWDAYWKSLPYQYPKGKWSEAYKYLQSVGYSEEQARQILTHGYMLDENGMLIDVPGRARKQYYSYNTMSDAEWDAYWNTVPDYTKYEKGAFGRTMKALKAMGYSDTQARTLIQQGLYANKDGTLMNVTGMERPVLGFPNFNAYYQSIPEYCRYEKGAFSRTYKALKSLGFDYDTSLRLIQQGAYLMDLSAAPALMQSLLAQQAIPGLDKIAVTDINTLLQKYGATIITSADGKPSVLINCSGLTRPRKTYSYRRRGGRGGSGRRYNKQDTGFIKFTKGFRGTGGGKRKRTQRPPKINSYKLRSPYLLQGNVSTFSGMTGFKGSNKLTKPYTTSGHVSTYSAQNFLNGASYGVRKVYKIDMRQYKTGAMSIKSSYPASYRNIAVAYRRNMYKDLYAKYGMSRMRMRANQQGYSNAAITRLRRNEIFNRERYAERRDLIRKASSGRRRASS